MLRRVTLALCLVALVSSGAAFAATTSRLTGEVFDQDGLPMPGVTVQISSDRLIGGPQIAIADDEGRFTFNLLPVGTYTVEATLVGFKPASGQVQVALDRTAEIVFNMVAESFGGEIEVTAVVPVVNTSQVNTSVTFDQDYLQNAAVGANNRDYLSMMGQAAGVQVGTANPSVFGGSSSDNSYLIDGLNTTDPTTGTFGTNFNFDAIQEMNFQTGGFEAEFGQATGGIVNLVTKSGGNEFSGSLDIRYRDQNMTENGEHYDRDEQESLYQSISGTLGGPILRDRLWFFASLEKVDTSRQNQGVRFPREFDGWNYIGKLTWQISDANRAVLKYSGAPADVTLWSDVFTDISARGNQYQTSSIWQAELNSVLSESVLLNASIGLFSNTINAGAWDGSTNVSGHTLRTEDQADVEPEDYAYFYHSYPATSLNDRFRNEFRVNSTFFVDNAVGSHEVKVGVEYSDMKFDNAFWYNGGAYIRDQLEIESPSYQFQDINGDGYYNAWMTLKEPLDEAEDITTSTGDILTFFAQDAWRPHPNVTVKPGVRWDNVKLGNHTGEQIADMDSWQPRFGIAWDIAGNSKYVLRASGGRFMDPTALSIPNFASGVVQTYHDYNTMEFYCNATRGLRCNPEDFPASFGDPIFFTNGEGIEYVLFDNREEPSVYEPAQTLDQAGVGHLQAPYADEFIVAFETQVARETSIEITYVNKKTNDIIEDTCSNNTWAWGDGEYPSLDDPTTWTTGAGCSFYMITNFQDFYRKYEGLILQAETRRNRLHLLGSYTYSESKGNTANGALQSYATALADYFPVHFYNRDGYLPDDRRHRLKVNGYYLFPHNWTVGFDGFYESAGHQSVFATCANLVEGMGEDPYLNEISEYCYTGDGAFLSTTDIFISKRGEYETESAWQLDLQGSKTWNLNKVDLTVVLTVYNIFDNEADRTFNTEAFVANEVGQTLTWYLPRRYEVGFRIEF